MEVQRVEAVVTSLIKKAVNQGEKNPATQKTHSQNTPEDFSQQDYVVEMSMWRNEPNGFNNTAENAVRWQY